MVAPFAAAAKAPQIAAGMLQAGQNLAAPRTLNPQTGAIVYHGSPHKFDAFDSSKIGTGEGAQAYGHGLYLAESPATAESYASMGRVKGWDVVPENGKFSAYIERAHEPGMRRKLGEFDSEALANNAAEVFRKKDAKLVYKVDLPDEQIARFLDWDKPLSQQAPEVQAALNRAPRINEVLAKYPGLSWKDLMSTGEFGSAEKASETLRQVGIPGIKYLDQGSRTGGKGTSNFVVFDDQLPKIVGRE